MFGALGGACGATSVSFVSQAALDAGSMSSLGLTKPLAAVRNTRSIGKGDMLLNNYRPKIEVDPQTYQVHADGVLLTCEPARSLPLAQRYFLF
jgi:urease subunit alpha